jgi:hypothetical protein
LKVGLLDRFRKNDGMSELRMNVAAGIAHAEQGRATSDIELQKMLAENQLLIKDENVTNIISGMCKTEWVDESGVLGVKNKKYSNSNPKYVALLNTITSLIRSSWISPTDAQIGVLDMRCLLRRIKMKMTEEEYEDGGALLVDSVYGIAKVNWLCAINGRMALTLKSNPRSMEVKVKTGKEKGEQT